MSVARCIPDCLTCALQDASGEAIVALAREQWRGTKPAPNHRPPGPTSELDALTGEWQTATLIARLIGKRPEAARKALERARDQGAAIESSQQGWRLWRTGQ